MKRPPPSPLPPSSSSSSSSSSCVNSPKTQKKATPKRARAKKTQNAADSSTSSTTKSRSSIFRGVTRHRWTGRFEAHLWDKSSWNSIQNKKGRQIYLGAYDNEESAARTYDLAALKYWGPGIPLNFPLETYSTEIDEMQKVTREEYLASLRRQSSGFSRGVSKYRGVARHHHNGRWEARIGRVSGNKYLYLGTYSTQEEAAAAYDMAAIEFRGPNAVTNFDISNYTNKLKKFTPLVKVKEEGDSQAINEEAPSPVPETTDHRHQQQQEEYYQMVEQNAPKLEITDSINSEVMATMMDPSEDMEHRWEDELCLDIGFNSLQVPNIPLDKPNEQLELFDEKGFQEDIDFIFDNSSFNVVDEFLQDTMSGTVGCKGMETGGRDEKGLNATTSYQSPPSRTTSVGSNI